MTKSHQTEQPDRDQQTLATLDLWAAVWIGGVREFARAECKRRSGVVVPQRYYFAKATKLLADLRDLKVKLSVTSSQTEALKLQWEMDDIVTKLEHQQLEPALLVLGLDKATTWFTSPSIAPGSFLYIHSLFNSIPTAEDYRKMAQATPEKFINATIHRVDQSEA